MVLEVTQRQRLFERQPGIEMLDESKEYGPLLLNIHNKDRHLSFHNI